MDKDSTAQTSNGHARILCTWVRILRARVELRQFRDGINGPSVRQSGTAVKHLWCQEMDVTG